MTVGRHGFSGDDSRRVRELCRRDRAAPQSAGFSRVSAAARERYDETRRRRRGVKHAGGGVFAQTRARQPRSDGKTAAARLIIDNAALRRPRRKQTCTSRRRLAPLFCKSRRYWHNIQPSLPISSPARVFDRITADRAMCEVESLKETLHSCQS